MRVGRPLNCARIWLQPNALRHPDSSSGPIVPTAAGAVIPGTRIVDAKVGAPHVAVRGIQTTAIRLGYPRCTRMLPVHYAVGKRLARHDTRAGRKSSREAAS